MTHAAFAPGRRLRAAAMLILAPVLAVAALLLPAGPVAATSPPQPGVTAVAPNHGPAQGGTEVVLTGYSLEIATQVRFDSDGPQGSDGTTVPVRRNDAGQYVATAPAGLAGVTADVIAQAYFGGGGWAAGGTFTWDGPTRRALSFAPASGAAAGGTTVTISGDGIDFSKAKSVAFGETAAPIVSKTASAVVVTAPAGQPLSSVPVTVTDTSGRIDGRPRDTFAYEASTEPPVITSVSPGELYGDKASYVVVKGRNLESFTKVEVGGLETYATRVGTGPDLRFYLYGADHQPGTIDVRVTTPVGVSENTPADDIKIIPVPPKPKITSFSPNSGGSGAIVTVRGEHFDQASLSFTGSAQARRVKLISSTEIRFTVGDRFSGNWLQGISISTPGGTTSSFDDGVGGFEYTTDAPDMLTLSPNSGPQTGGTEVTVTHPFIDFRDVVEVSLGGRTFSTATITAKSATSLTFVTPPSAFAWGPALDLWDADGDHVNGYYDNFGYTPADIDLAYAVTGSAVLKTFTRGSLALNGRFAFTVAADGAISGDLTLQPATARLTAIGFLPVTAKLAFVPAGKTTGTLALDSNELTTTTKTRIKVLEAKLFGAIPLAGGNSCQTKQLTDLTLSNEWFDRIRPSELSGTFKISDLNGCGPLNGLVSSATASSGNTITLKTTPIS